MRTQSQRHDLFISAEVINELSTPVYPQAAEALSMISDIPVIGVDADIGGFAHVLVRELVMPGPASGDAIHVAACVIFKIDYLLSWNVRHLANPNKMAHLRVICVRLGYMPPAIITPDLLWEISK